MYWYFAVFLLHEMYELLGYMDQMIANGNEAIWVNSIQNWAGVESRPRHLWSPTLPAPPRSQSLRQKGQTKIQLKHISLISIAEFTTLRQYSVQ